MTDFKNCIAALKRELNTHHEYHVGICHHNTAAEDKDQRFVNGKMAAGAEFLNVVQLIEKCIIENPGQEVPVYWTVTNQNIANVNDKPAEEVTGSVTHTVSF